MHFLSRLFRGRGHETVPSLPWREIERATDSFSRESLFLIDGFSEIFTGTMPVNSETQEVLIEVFGNLRRFDLMALEQGSKEFHAVKRVLSTPHAQHPNIIRLIFQSTNSAARNCALVYLASTGRRTWLRDILRNESKLVQAGSADVSTDVGLLSWDQRLGIAEDVARGLAHLHDPGTGTGIAVVHRDINPMNVLVALPSGRAQISAFALASMVREGEDQENFTVAGTMGYLDPELFKEDGRLSPKNDVYSFGVLLLQLATGHDEPVFRYYVVSGERVHICAWVAKEMAQHQGPAEAAASAVMGKVLHDELLFKSSACQDWTARDSTETLSSNEGKCLQFSRFLALARQCSRWDGGARPTMAQVVEALGAIRHGAPTCTADQWLREQARADKSGRGASADMWGLVVHSPSTTLGSEGSWESTGEEAERPAGADEDSVHNRTGAQQEGQLQPGASVPSPEKVEGGGSNHPPTTNLTQRLSRTPLSGVIEYSLAELQGATGKFSKVKVLGKGTFGVVYSGHLRGTAVAIKRMKSGNLLECGLQAEVKILTRVRHPHVVTLMGMCPDPDHPCLVYEFLSGGDLSESLRQKEGRPPLSALDRFRIASQVASALAYMAQREPPIVHRDLKPRNIMLDQHRAAKVADWGLARAAAGTFNSSAAGTAGYMAPETAFYRIHSTASDTFAFGVILLQLVTGVEDPRLLRQKESNGDVSMDMLPREAIMAQLDSSAGPWPEHLAERVVALALKCASVMKGERPTMVGEVHPLLTGTFEEASVWFSEGQAPS